jgi:hypothetical protein
LNRAASVAPPEAVIVDDNNPILVYSQNWDPVLVSIQM